MMSWWVSASALYVMLAVILFSLLNYFKGDSLCRYVSKEIVTVCVSSWWLLCTVYVYKHIDCVCVCMGMYIHLHHMTCYMIYNTDVNS